MNTVDSMLEIQHKRQQSHDSGTYQDWPHEELKETNYNSNVTGEFVTVVAIDTAENTPSPEVEKPFVTVLSIDPLSQPETEEVLVYRLPGERLGFGLKFEGGIKTVEKVGRLYIQSCAADSPASRTSASWGPLVPGDEIVGVDGVLVSDMTRIDCVRALKESNVVIKLQVRQGKDPKSKIQQQQESQAPPIPPRKFPRKKETIDPPQGFDDKKGSPPVVPRSRANVPQAEVYTDILSQELLQPVESESDDTGSSISTVVSRISSTPTTSNSSFSDARSITSMDANITSPPTPTSKHTPFDLDKVLEPFLQLEREFSSSTIDQSSIFSKLVEASTLIDSKEESTLKPPENFQDSDAELKDAPELPPKPSPRKSESLEKPKSEKRRPPPPPPRNDRSLHPNPVETPSASHLPRLIDFVPKDRTDLVVPSPLLATETSTKPVIVGTELKEKGADEEVAAKPEPAGTEVETTFDTGPDTGPTKSIESSTMACNVHSPCSNRMLSPGITEQFPTLPSYSRLPPDGHEFPMHYDENVKKVKAASKSLPVPNSKPLIKQNLEVTRKTSLPCTDSYKHALWRNDEKSEKSVRDKIAMFSTAATQPASTAVSAFQLKKLNKFKSSDDVSSAHSIPLSKNLKEVEPKSPIPDGSPPIKKGLLPYHSLLDVTSDYGGELSKKDSSRTQSTTDLSNIEKYDIDTSKIECSTLPRKHEQKSNGSGKMGHVPSLTRAVSFSGTTKLHSRSQSLTDVGARAHLYNCRSTEEARRSSLNHLIEQRKKSMSKLRGLVIPEKVMEVPPPKFVVDLPEIQSKDCLLPNVTDRAPCKMTQPISKQYEEPVHNEKPVALPQNKAIPVMPVPPWRAEANIYDLPKYSPAFKRKSLALYYGAPSSVSSVSSSLSSSREELRSCFSDVTKPSSVMPAARNVTPSRNPLSSPMSHTEPKSLESITSPSMSDLSFEYASSSSSPSLRNNYEVVNKSVKYDNSSSGKPHFEIRGEEESDNDSAVSSSRSSVSHGYTPPHSPMPGYHRNDGTGHSNSTNNGGMMLKRTLSSETTASTSSNGSTLTSGSQASCSSNSSIDSRRVLKPQSVEAINRKNVLASAKYSSGLDLKLTVPTAYNKNDGNDTSNQNEEPINNVASSKSVSPVTVIENEVIDPDEFFIQTEVECFSKEKPIIEEKIERIDSRIDESVQDSVDHPLISPPKEFYIESDKNESISSSNTEDSSIANNSITPDEPDSVSAKDSVDSLDSNKSLHSSVEWEDKDPVQTPFKQPLENGIGKYTENRSSRAMKLSPTQKSVSVNSIKKVFEKVDCFAVSNGRLKNNGLSVNTNIQHPRVSSIDSTTSDDSYIPMPNTPYGSVSNLQKEQQFGSITSLASSTSLISQQELAQLIEEANHNLEDGGNSHEVIVVILHRDTPGGSIGITLAGGADYEAKEITVHKVLVGSPAERDGRIQKGDRILSINGKSMKGLTHYESLAILKAPRPEVVLVVSRHKADTPEEMVSTRRLSRYIEPKYTPSFDKGVEMKWGPIVTVELIKDGAGLGFSLEGGKDSPFGDQPLTVKKIFTGGCAEKCGQLYAGDELLSVNNIDLSELSRIEAWALMKRLPDGKVHLNIRHPLT
uniref:Pro-interleukin-16 n=1 Tax=Lygus hesperus TaxID=30085 RepID=A0A146LUS4_LYGHE